MDLYYKTLMWSLRLVTGDKKIKTWTFHKGFLRILGNDWVNREPKNSFFRVLWTVIYPTAYIFLEIANTVLTIKCAVRLEKSDTLQFIRGMNGFIVSLTFVYSAFKGLVIKLRSRELLELMDMVDELGDLDDEGLSYRDRALFNCSLYTGLLFLNPGAWTIYFIFFHNSIPFQTDFPWGEETPVGYFFSFATDFVTAVYCAALHSVYDTMFPVVVGTLSGHLAMLGSRLATLGRDQTKEIPLLADAYHLHVRILRIIKNMNDCFRTIFFVQTMYTVLHACVIIYQVMQVSDITLAIMNTGPMLSAAYFQLLMYCYYGQLLTTNFEKLKTSLCNNSWYDSNIHVKKSLALMMTVADRPVNLNAFGITSAAHPTYLSSLQDSISYYLILKTVTTEE